MTLLTARSVFALLVGVAVSVSTGCQEKGPAEKAGQAIDRAAEKAKDAVHPPGPVEKAGREVDKTINK